MSLRLGSFPSEILGLILNEPSSSFLVITLWKCGDSILNAKLSRCITSVDLCLHKFASDLRNKNLSHECRAFPRLLSSLENLRHFSIATSLPFYRLGTNNSPRREILELPPSLETLKVTSLDAELFFMDLPNETTATGDGYWPNHAVRTKHMRGSSKMINLGALFPKLSTLAVSGRRPTDKAIFQYEDFAALPDTLTKLTWPYISTDNTHHRLWRYLPRNLTTLDASVSDEDGVIDLTNHFDSNSFSCLPYLETIKSYKSRAKGKAFHLPQTIKTCKTTIYENSVHIRGLPAGITSKLCLIQFESPTIDCPWTAFIPAHLTTLKISKSQILGDHVSQLPWTLTELELEGTPLDWQLMRTMADSGVPFWPVGWKLTKLSLTSIRQFEAYSVILLPRTLTFLEIDSPHGFERHKDDEDELRVAGSDFPPHLETLLLGLHLVITIKTHAQSLPTTLKRLNCEGINFSRASFELLPDSITWLQTTKPCASDVNVDDSEDSSIDIGCDDSSEDDRDTELLRLPARLETLIFDEGIWDMADFGALPRSLTSLTLQKIRNFRLPSSDIFEALPTCMRWLKISNIPNTRTPHQFPDSCFSTLQELEMLWFAVDDAVFNEDVLKTLSRRLTELRLRLGRLTAKGASFLPPRLLEVDFGYNIKWSPEIIAHWPMAFSKSNRLPEKESQEVYKRHCDMY